MSFVFPTNASQVQAFAGALYGVQVGSTTMAQVNADIAANGGLARTLNSYYTASFGGVANATVANTVATNLGLTGAALTSGVAYITAQLNAAAADARGQVISSIVSLFSNLSADATFGAAATAWNTKVAIAAAYTGSANVAVGTEVTTNGVFNLTTGTDAKIFGAGNDSFDASLSAGNQTLGSGDVLDGGAGTDSLYAVLTGSVTPARLTGIENISFTANAAATLGLANATGVTSVTSGNAAGAVTISGIAQSVAVTVADTTKDHTVTFTGVTGTADSATVTLQSVTGGTHNIAGIETLNVISAGSGNSGVTVTAGAATTLNISGSADLDVSAASNTVSTTINASALTGALTVKSDTTTAATITGGAGNDAITIVGGTAANVNVNGGAGNDTVTFTASLANGDTLNGGDGVDTLVAASAEVTALTAQTPVTVTNFERIQVSNDLGANLTTANVQAGIDRVNLTGKTGGNTITFEAGTRTLAMAAATGGNIVVNDTGTATTDALTLLNTSAGTNVYDTQAITVGGFETVTLNTSTTTTRVLNQVNTIQITPDVGGSATLNISGNNSFQSAGITATGATTSAKIDASGLTGTAFFKNTAATVGITAITGSVNGDVIVGSATATTIDGGAGNDNITGGAGNDSLLGGLGDDTLAAAAGTDTVDGGAGNDRVDVASGALSANDVIRGDADTDTLAFAALVDADNDAGLLTGISGFEVLEVTAAASRTLAMSNFINNQAFARVDVADQGGSTLTLNNVAAATNEVRLLAGAVGDTVAFDRLIDNSTGDTLTISARADLSGANAVTKFTALDEETINISGSSAANDLTITTLVVDDMTTLNVTGAADVVITNAITGAAKLATVNASAATGVVTVNATNSLVAITATAGSGVFTFTGGAMADTINGGAAADVLTGGSGADSITGGENTDVITGGTGRDTIVLTETVAAADSVRFAEAGASNVDTVTGFAATGTRDVVGLSIGNINNVGTINTLSTANGTDVSAAVTAGNATVVLRADGSGAATAAAIAANLLMLGATNVSTFAEAIGTNGFTNAAIDAGVLATEGVAAVWYDVSAGQAVFGYIQNTSTGTADTLNSADTFVEVVRVGITAANYTQANITAAFELF